MAETAEKRRLNSALREGGRYTPNSFHQSSWWRFAQDRRRRYLKLLPDVPDERQALAIEQLIEAEWLARRAEHDAENATSSRDRYYARRLGADMRKQILLWARELTFAIAAANKTEPAPSQPSLPDVLADIARRRPTEPEPSDDEEFAA